MKPEPMIGEADVARAMKARASQPVANLKSLEPVLVGSLGDAWPYLARAAISAHLEALERAGWKLVTVAPTETMRMAGARAICEQKCFRGDILGEPCINPETHLNAPCKANDTQLLLSFRASAALNAYGEMLAVAPPPQNSDEVKP